FIINCVTPNSQINEGLILIVFNENSNRNVTSKVSVDGISTTTLESIEILDEIISTHAELKSLCLLKTKLERNRLLFVRRLWCRIS
ncbi:hypothetical protein Trydic_g4924, partial [Trypoxylus dichotomus]